MARRFLSALTLMLFLVPFLAACASETDPSASQDVRIYQVLPVARNSKLVNAEGEGEAVALVNTGSKPRMITGWSIQTNAGRAELPRVTLKSGEVIYFANDVEYFRKYWNFAPHYEYGADTDKAVPDLKLPEQKAPVMGDGGDVVRLVDRMGSLVDLVVFGAVGNAPAPWSGPPVELVNSFPLTPSNQVITRIRSGSGWLLDPTANSFSGGTRTEPQRVFFAGQSSFPVRTVAGKMTLVAASAPDNAGPTLLRFVNGAQSRIRLAGYQYNLKEGLTDALIAAVRRGVKVQVAIERNPGGSDMFDSDKEAQQKLHEGGIEILYYHKWDGDLSSRINPLHSKYGIFDDTAVMISTGNYTSSVFGGDATCGNREWVAFIQGNPEITTLVEEVWNYDLESGHVEVRGYNPRLDGPLQPDTYDAGPCIPYRAVKPQPAVAFGEAKVTRVLAPDNTLDRENGFLGLLRSARQELWVSANYIYKWWGPAAAEENLTRYPQPYLTEILSAARRGVEVKVLLDRRNVRTDSLRDNHQVVRYLNEIAAREKLKLEARLVNMDQSGIGRTYHNKSFIVDGAVVISSINGSENSFRYAREMALKFDGAPAFTSYYKDLFLHDWNASDRPNYPWNLLAMPRRAGTFIDWSPNAELDVVGYEVFWKPDSATAWTRLGEVKRPGYDDDHQKGVWGVVAVTASGKRSNYAEISR